MNRKKFKRGKK